MQNDCTVDGPSPVRSVVFTIRREDGPFVVDGIIDFWDRSKERVVMTFEEDKNDPYRNVITVSTVKVDGVVASSNDIRVFAIHGYHNATDVISNGVHVCSVYVPNTH